MVHEFPRFFCNRNFSFALLLTFWSYLNAMFAGVTNGSLGAARLGLQNTVSDFLNYNFNMT